MKQQEHLRTVNISLVPVIGFGAYLDVWEKEITGVDAWNYTILFFFIRIRIGKIYKPDEDSKPK